MKQFCLPGRYISLDQLESRTPGFIGVLKGLLTKKRYTFATIFVDHYSGYTYIYVQTSINFEETVKVKETFESICLAMGVHIHYYHVDNGRFFEKKFTKAIRSNVQTISFCGMSAYFQNGKAEKRIIDLQDQA